MWELDYRQSWAQNWCFWTVVLEKTLESLLDCKEIQPVLPIGDQTWVFIGRTDVEAETPTIWPLMWRADSLEKTLMLERLKAGGEGDEREWYGWMASPTQWIWVWVNSGSWWWTWRPCVLQSVGRIESDTTERLNWTELIVYPLYYDSLLWVFYSPSFLKYLLCMDHHFYHASGYYSGSIFTLSSKVLVRC